MRRRFIRALVAVPVVLALGAGAALAVELTAGTGITNEGATLGFNAKADLTGQITYVFHDGTGQMIQCDEITSYRTLKPTAKGFLRTKVTADCEDKDGNPVYAEFYFLDAGEPGTRDRIRAFFTYDETYRLDANSDPNALLTLCNSGALIAQTGGCKDVGIIQDGNVQILVDSDPTLRQTVVLGTV
jgi:hypothetical protein